MRRGLFILYYLLLGGLATYAQKLTLFSPEMRSAMTQQQVVIMDFLERYLNELPSTKQTTIEQKMADDKVYFRKGKVEDLRQITDAMPFSISLQDKYYEVSWSKQDSPFVSIVFPAQFELISGMPQNEAQQKFKEIVLSAPERNVAFIHPENPDLIGEGIYVDKNEIMEIESLTDATYYNKVENDFIPVFDNRYLPYSAANLFHSLIQDKDYQLYVEQSVYGLSTINYTLTLDQWLNYCAEQGLKIFFGIEQRQEDGLMAVVIAQSVEFGYNHLLSVLIPNTLVEQNSAVMKVRLTPYIPTHNVKSLYQQETTNKTKKT